jgi:hypothetical protein
MPSGSEPSMMLSKKFGINIILPMKERQRSGCLSLIVGS